MEHATSPNPTLLASLPPPASTDAVMLHADTLLLLHSLHFGTFWTLASVVVPQMSSTAVFDVRDANTWKRLSTGTSTVKHNATKHGVRSFLLRR